MPRSPLPAPPPPPPPTCSGHGSSSFWNKISVHHSGLHPGTTWSAKWRSCCDARLFSVNVIFMPVPQKICPASVIVLLIFCPSIAGGLKICHASVVVLHILSLNSWWLDSIPWEKRKKNDYKNMLRCTILTQLDPEWKWIGKDHTAELIYPNRHGMVQYLAVSLHTGTCLFEEGERWQWKFVVFASSRWCLWHLVWQEVFPVLLADQHRKWSCLVGASTCFWS